MSTLSVSNSKTRPALNKRSSSISVKRKKRKKNSDPSIDTDNFNSKSRHYVSSLDKQIVFRDIITQFVEWPTWQKRLLLCRVTERTSSTLLSTLATVLEPIFHRDFEVKSKHGFHTSLIRTFAQQRRKSSCSVLRPTTPMSVHTLSPIVEPVSNHSSRSVTSVTAIQLRDTERLSSQPSANKGVDVQVSPPSSEDSNQRSSPLPLNLHSPTSSSLRVNRRESRRGSLKDIDHRLSVSSIADSLKALERRGTSHTHAIDRNSSSLSTMEFLLYSQKKNVSKLGVLVKPSTHVHDIACVKQYKHKKLWLPPIDNGCMLKRVSKKSLLRSFQKIIDVFVGKYMSWNNAEKGDFMLHVVDYCEPDEIKFFAGCIYQRVEHIEDINNVNDNVLLNIFSYLQIEDLARIAQVCKRWKYLASCAQIWERKCCNLAYKHDQLDVIKNLEMSSVELDWKQLYNELKESILFLESFDAQVNVSSPSIVSKQDLSERSCSFVDETQQLEDMHETDVNNNGSVTTLVEGIISDMQIIDDIPDVESVCMIKDHVRFAIEQNESMMKVMLGSNDDMGDNYATEEELKDGLEETAQEEHNIEKDTAFDVRVKLVQAPNQLGKKVVSEPDVDDDYQLMQISNIKTVNRVRKLEGHVDAVLCLQFDSKRVVTGSSDRTVRFWDIRSGRCFHKLVGHQGGIRCLQFDEKYIATGSWDTTVMIWDVVNFTLICTIIEHSNCVSCVEITSDFLITASHDTTVCIFEKDSWVLLSRLEEHTAPISCMCLISPIELLTGSHDRMIVLWDLDTYCVLRKFVGMKHSCLCVKVCGGLVAAGASDGTLTFWDMSTSTMEGCIVAHDAPVNALCFVQSRFFSAGANVVKEWDLSTCTCLRSLQGHTGAVLCLRASSKRVVSGSADGTSRIWDMACKLQQVGRNYDELNKNIIPTKVLNEHQFKEICLAK